MRHTVAALLLIWASAAVAGTSQWENKLPCDFWESKLAGRKDIATDDWRRSALHVCQDDLKYSELGVRKPDSLVAARAMLDTFQSAFYERQELFFAANRAVAAEGGDIAHDPRVLRYVLDDGGQLDLARETGLLDVLEAVENGY